MKANNINEWFQAAQRNDVAFLKKYMASYANTRDVEGNTALMHAVQTGDTRAAELLVSVEAGRVNNEGYTASVLATKKDFCPACMLLFTIESRIILPNNMSLLMIAAKASALECIKFFAEYYGAEVDDNGWTALDYAAEQGNLKATQILLSKITGLGVNEITHAIGVAQNVGNKDLVDFLETALSKKQREELACQKCISLQAYIVALEEENRKALNDNAKYREELIEKDNEIEKLKLTVNSLLLETNMRRIFAVENETSTTTQPDVYRKRQRTLTTKSIKADLFNISDVEINTAAFLDYMTYVAEFYNFSDLISKVDLIIEKGSTINSIRKSTVAAKTPFIKEITADIIQTLTNFRDSANNIQICMKNLITIIDNQLIPRSLLEEHEARQSPLIEAVLLRDFKKLKRIFPYIGLRDIAGRTALINAAINDLKDAIVALAPLEAGYRDLNGNLAIDYCLRNGDLEMAAILLPYDFPQYKELSLESSEFEKTPLMYAAELGKTLDCFCYIQLGMSKKQDNQGQTALMFAAGAGQEEAVRILVPYEAALCDYKGRTALYYAACNDHVNCVKLLVEIEARIQRQDTKWTALMAAASNGHITCVKELQAHESGMRDASSCTALMLAAQNGHTSCVRALLKEEGRMVTTSLYQQGEGCTALMMAAYCGQKECVEVLLPVEYDIEKKTINSETNSTALNYACIPNKGISEEVRESIISIVEEFLRTNIAI